MTRSCTELSQKRSPVAAILRTRAVRAVRGWLALPLTLPLPAAKPILRLHRARWSLTGSGHCGRLRAFRPPCCLAQMLPRFNDVGYNAYVGCVVACKHEQCSC
jgi:hypothetical protein